MGEETNLLAAQEKKTAQEKEDWQRLNDGEPAGFWIRFGAVFLDALLVALPLSLLVSILFTGLWPEYTYENQPEPGLDVNFSIGLTAERGPQGVTDLLMIFYWLIIPVVWTGYTVGKRIAGIRTRRVDGKAISFITTLLRHIVATLVYTSPIILISFLGSIGIPVFPGLLWFGGLLSLSLYVTSAIMAGTRADTRTIHDFVAGTEVVRSKKRKD